jgi:putative SOS response-associated peptidase YedK
MQIGKIMHRDVNIIAPPVDNFYEWKKVAGGKQPYEISLADRGFRALAGLWENWRSSASERVRSFAIAAIAAGGQTAPNSICKSAGPGVRG